MLPDPSRTARRPRQTVVRRIWQIVVDDNWADAIAAEALDAMQRDPFGDVAARYGLQTTWLASAGTPSGSGSLARIRQYGPAGPQWLEHIESHGDQIVKIREALPPMPMARVTAGLGGGSWVPGFTVTAERQAFELPTGGGRLTIDRSLRASKGTGSCAAVALSAEAVVQLKFPGAPPADFRRLLREFRLEPRPYSFRADAVASLRGAGVHVTG